MATIKDWVRSNVAWDWMKANGYQTFREHDSLVEGVDNGTITEEMLYSEEGFNFPPMPEGWKSFEELQAEAKARFKEEMAKNGMEFPSDEFEDSEPRYVIITDGKE